jgi:hypothetical protein
MIITVHMTARVAVAARIPTTLAGAEACCCAAAASCFFASILASMGDGGGTGSFGGSGRLVGSSGSSPRFSGSGSSACAGSGAAAACAFRGLAESGVVASNGGDDGLASSESLLLPLRVLTAQDAMRCTVDFAPAAACATTNSNLSNLLHMLQQHIAATLYFVHEHTQHSPCPHL